MNLPLWYYRTEHFLSAAKLQTFSFHQLKLSKILLLQIHFCTYKYNTPVVAQEHEGPPGFVYTRRTSWIFVYVHDLTIIQLSLPCNSTRKWQFHRSVYIWFGLKPCYYLSLLITRMWKHFWALNILKGFSHERKKQYAKWKVSALLLKVFGKGHSVSWKGWEFQTEGTGYANTQLSTVQGWDFGRNRTI